MQIEHETEFMEYMKVHGPSSPDSRLSYVSYLESASKYSRTKISPETCGVRNRSVVYTFEP
jgi:hypothetical protein